MRPIELGFDTLREGGTDLYGRRLTRCLLWFSSAWGWPRGLYDMTLSGVQRGRIGRTVYVQAAADAGFRARTIVADSISGEAGRTVERSNMNGFRTYETIETPQVRIQLAFFEETFSAVNITTRLSQSAQVLSTVIKREGWILQSADIPLLLS
jgi:hypothetical protein